jgi:division protein CdvB (Snf7/Vps24/ESCRT-III family)
MYQEEVAIAIQRMKKRYNMLTHKAVDAYMHNHKERALIYADELYTVRKLVAHMNVIHVGIERIIERLETISDVSDVANVMVNISGLLSGLKPYAEEVMPRLARAMDSIIEQVNNITTSTSPVHEVPENPYMVTKESEEELKRIKELVNEKIEQTMPLTVFEVVKRMGEGDEKVGVVVRDSNAVKIPVKTPKKLISPKEVDRRVLEYIVAHGGFIDVADAASEIGVPREEIRASLHRLKSQGKLIF